MTVRGQTFDGGDVRLGAYKLSADVLRQISAFEPLAPDAAVSLPEGWRRDGDSLFHGSGSTANPAIGDLRVSFAAVDAQPISVVAGESGGALSAFHDPNGYTTVIVKLGVASADAMFKAKKQEERTLTWILRAAGFVVMLIAFLLIAGPVSTLLAVLPFLEGIAEAGTFLIAFTLALPLTLVIVALAWVAHRPLVGGALVIGAIAVFVLIRRMHPRPAARPAAG